MTANTWSERSVVKDVASVFDMADRKSFTEYLTLAIRDADGNWIANEVECQVSYLHDTAENGRPARTQILSVRAECAGDVIDLLPAMSEAQVADLKRTALNHEGAVA